MKCFGAIAAKIHEIVNSLRAYFGIEHTKQNEKRAKSRRACDGRQSLKCSLENEYSVQQYNTSLFRTIQITEKMIE